MTRKYKKKMKRLLSEMMSVSTDKFWSEEEVTSDDIVRLKVSVRKGARIESVPLRKLERLASRPRLYWKLEDGWLVLVGF